MKTDYRNEYYYKNTLLNKLLIGKHSVNTCLLYTSVYDFTIGSPNIAPSKEVMDALITAAQQPESYIDVYKRQVFSKPLSIESFEVLAFSARKAKTDTNSEYNRTGKTSNE